MIERGSPGLPIRFIRSSGLPMTDCRKHRSGFRLRPEAAPVEQAKLFQYSGVTYWPGHRFQCYPLFQHPHDSYCFQIIVRAKELSMFETKFVQIIFHDISIPDRNDRDALSDAGQHGQAHATIGNQYTRDIPDIESGLVGYDPRTTVQTL